MHERKQISRDFLIGWNRVYSASRPSWYHHPLPDQRLVGRNFLPGRNHRTPLLHSAQYGYSKLYVLTIPDNFDDLYACPPKCWAHREVVTKACSCAWSSGNVSLFFTTTIPSSSNRSWITAWTPGWCR